MSSGRMPGRCGVHGRWADDTVPTGEDHGSGSGSAPCARICLPCARSHVDSGTASAQLAEQVKAMEERAEGVSS